MDNQGPKTFPHPKLTHPSGVLAIGGALDKESLLLAYHFGIFPWFNPGEPVLWWHPDPRCVIFPSQVKVSKSMRPYFNQGKYSVSYNTCFKNVIEACRDIYRPGQPGTWISPEFIEAYTDLYEDGHVISVEVWNQEKELVGGLYGVKIANVFFGESMFSKSNNASKFGFISLCRKLEEEGCHLVDCQIETPHLRTLGAQMIPREEFMRVLEENRKDYLRQLLK